MTSKEIYSLQRELLENPDSLPLRLQLARLLIEEELFSDATTEIQHVLTSEPDHREALQLAITAAEGTGDDKRARSFQRLYQALASEDAEEFDTKKVASTEADDAEIPLESFSEEAEREKPSDKVVQLRALDGGREQHEDEEDSEIPQITLADVGGMEEVKKRLNMAFLEPYKNPMFRQMYKKSLSGGLLLYGPPGCGKTYIARAVAGELGARFMNIGLTDVLSMWIGESERQLQQLFEQARRKSPTVVFIDEIDALGQKRSHLKHSPMRKVVAALLAELDGWEDNNKDVFLIAATNHPWDVDPALRRPGRLDRTMLVLPPDKDARHHILERTFSEKPTTDDIDIHWLSKKTEGFSGADLVHLADSAVELAMAEAIASGTMVPVSFNHCKQVLKDINPACSSWFETARNYAMYANDSGTYDELLSYIQKKR